MRVAVVGSGKLASELLTKLQLPEGMALQAWRDAEEEAQATFVVHAGSGRQLPQVMDFCARTGATLLELSTGSTLEDARPTFPLVLCPNTNILMLKFMGMLAVSGHLFHGHDVVLEESHQSGKSSAPGTALAMARSLGRPADTIVSVRDPQRQATEYAVPPEHLARHAVHRIRIRDGDCSLHLEARVMGPAPYARGVGRLLSALRARRLEPRIYQIEELILAGWL